MVAPPRRAGTVAWIDLDSPDVDDARRFYAGLFGWELTTDDTGEEPYTVAATAAGPVGGMMARPPERVVPGVPAVWTVFFAVADIDAAFARAVELGGTGLQDPMPIPGGDRIAVVEDPVGGVVGMMESHVDEGMAYDSLGAVSWVECESRDLAASRSFYEGLFSWTAVEGTGGYWVFELDGEQVGGLMAMPDGVPAEIGSYWLGYRSVADVDAVCETAVELGGTVAVPTMTIDEGRFAVLEDRQGGLFAVFSSGN